MSTSGRAPVGSKPQKNSLGLVNQRSPTNPYHPRVSSSTPNTASCRNDELEVMIDFPLSNFSPIEPKQLKQTLNFEGVAKSRPVDHDPTGLGLGNAVQKNREQVPKGRFPAGVSDIGNDDGGASSKRKSPRGVVKDETHSRKLVRVPSGEQEVESRSSVVQATRNTSVSSVTKVTSTSSPVVVSDRPRVSDDAGEVLDCGGNHSAGLQTNRGGSVTDNAADLASVSVTDSLALTTVTDKPLELSTNIASLGSLVSSNDSALREEGTVLDMPSCCDTPRGVGVGVCHPTSSTGCGKAEGRVQQHTSIVSWCMFQRLLYDLVLCACSVLIRFLCGLISSKAFWMHLFLFWWHFAMFLWHLSLFLRHFDTIQWCLIMFKWHNVQTES